MLLKAVGWDAPSTQKTSTLMNVKEESYHIFSGEKAG
jgi:hypothetical protein